jgi:hypothetical protein
MFGDSVQHQLEAYIVNSLMQDVPSGVTFKPLAAMAVSKKPAKTSFVMPTPTGIPLM